MKVEGVCQDCKYWSRLEPLNRMGLCEDADDYGMPPVMDENDFCDRFKQGDNK